MTGTTTLRIAAAQPATIIGDLGANVAAHADAVRRCAARVVVFPEMSLTGYDMTVPAVDPGDRVLDPLIGACREMGSLALVGAAVGHGEERAIGVIAVNSDGADVVYRKMSLGGPETANFQPGSSPAIIEIDGWRVGLGVCKDTRIDDHLDATFAAGIDLYAAGLVHAPGELAEFDVRARCIASRGPVPVVFAGFAGPTGGGYPETCGGSAIWGPDGTLLVQAGAEPGEFVVWDV